MGPARADDARVGCRTRRSPRLRSIARGARRAVRGAVLRVAPVSRGWRGGPGTRVPLRGGLAVPPRPGGVLRVRHSAGFDRANDLVGVERSASKLHADRAVVDRDERVLGASLGARRPRLKVVDREPNTSRVHVVGVAEPSGPLLVRVAAGEDLSAEAFERRAELLLVHPRADELLARAGRGVEREERAPFAEVDVDNRRKALVELEQLG